MRYAIIALMLVVLLSGCAKVHTSARPDLVVYTKDIQNKAADEIESNQCPVIGNVMMPDYLVMRDQTKALK